MTLIELSAVQILLGFVLLLTPIVFIHELGHYLLARRAGVQVEVFSIGFGPELFGWTSSETGTRWRLALIPLGGYVRMLDEVDPHSDDPEDEWHPEGSFHDAGVWWRIAIVSAGPVANFILGIALFACVYMFVGKVFLSAEIGEVLPESPAEEAGFVAGDIVTQIDGISVRDFNDIRQLVLESPGRELEFTVLRDARFVSLAATPQSVYNERYRTDIGVLGVRSAETGTTRRLYPPSAVMAATSDAFRMTILILRNIARVGKGEVRAGDIQGPVGIAKISGDALSGGLVPFILLTALISINLGIVNLLPVPMLDGGHLMFYFYEVIAGRPLPLFLSNLLLRMGTLLILGIMTTVIYFDIMRLVD